MIYLTSVELTDVRGIPTFKTEFGRYVTEVRAANAVGKTSVKVGIASFFQPGGDRSLVAHGALYADCKLTTSEGLTFHKRVYADGRQYTLEVLGPEGGVLPAPRSVIESVLETGCFDPDDIIDADTDTRLKFLFAYCEPKFSVEEINRCFSVKPGDVAGLLDIQLLPPDEPVGLAKFDEYRKQKYSARSRINISWSEFRSTINRLEENRLPDDGFDWNSECDRIQRELTAADTDIAAIRRGYELGAEEKKTEARSKADTEISELRKKISDLEMKRATDCAAIDRKAAELIEQESAPLRDKKNALSTELGTARANAQRRQEAIGVRNVLDEQKKKRQGCIVQAAQLTGIISAMDRLKAEKLRQLPVPQFDIAWRGAIVSEIDGIATVGKGKITIRSDDGQSREYDVPKKATVIVQEGQQVYASDPLTDGKAKAVITIAGTDFDSLSAQEQCFVAIQFIRAAQKVQMQKHGNKTIPLLLIDNAERMTTESVQELKRAARAVEAQLVMFFATPGVVPLEVEVEN